MFPCLIGSSPRRRRMGMRACSRDTGVFYDGGLDFDGRRRALCGGEDGNTGDFNRDFGGEGREADVIGEHCCFGRGSMYGARFGEFGGGGGGGGGGCGIMV